MNKICACFLTIVKSSLFICFTFINIIRAGQNSSALLKPDLNTNSFGNQNQTYSTPIPANELVKIDIYVESASNLDTYEFNMIFNPLELEFVEAHQNQPITTEKNFLIKNTGTTIGWTTYLKSDGLLNIANTLVGNNLEDTPNGEGLLAHVVFRALTITSGKILFDNIKFLDNTGILDIGTSSSDVSLPVVLTSFKGYPIPDGVRLKWETASEINNFGFNIFRSLDSLKNFSKLNSDLILGQGNSSSLHKYDFFDNTVKSNLWYYYYLQSVSFNGEIENYSTISLFSGINNIPSEYALKQNFPNPFNNTTKIIYHLPEITHVSLNIYNLLGERVYSDINKRKSPGIYQFIWNVSDLPSGLYIINLRTKNYSKSRKMVVLK
jgi:hypothetical protein